MKINYTSSTKEILQAVSELYDRIVDENLLIRRFNIAATHVRENLQFRTSRIWNNLIRSQITRIEIVSKPRKQTLWSERNASRRLSCQSRKSLGKTPSSKE